MVSGSKNKSPKKKEKMVFAKDKKQVVTMVVVLSALGINTVYMIVKAIMDQMPQTNTSSQQGQNSDLDDPLAAKSQQATTETGQNPNGTPQTSTTAQQQVAPNAAPQPSFPFLPIFLILLVVIAGAFAAKKFLGNAANTSSDPRQKSSSKKSGNKPGKMPFAKDKKQVVTMLVILAIFLGNGLRMIIQGIMDQMPQKATPSSAQSVEDKMAQQQQQDLQSLNNPNQPNDNGDISISQDANNIYMQTMNQNGEAGHPAVNDNLKSIQANDSGDVDILVKNKELKRSSKMVFVSVSNSGRSNPFLPASENVLPQSLSYLTPPPETALQNSDAGKVMTTTISGILYDKYNPSAIINIEGSDYLVKIGDIIHSYKVLSITKNQVLVQLGKNIYKAGVGELLSQTDLNYNVIANLNKKFGGNNVSIHVRKKR